MTEFRIKWQAFPRVQHLTRVFFVEADSADAAKAVAHDHIERAFGVSLFEISSVESVIRPTGGRVLPTGPS